MNVYPENCDELISKIIESISLADESKVQFARQLISLLYNNKLVDYQLHLLKAFSFYISSQKGHFYNMGYFVERIDDFSKAYKSACERLISISKNALKLSKENKGLLVGKTICYDDIYSFEIDKEGIYKVQLDIDSLISVFKNTSVSIRVSDTKRKFLEFSQSYEVMKLNEITESDDPQNNALLNDYKDVISFFSFFEKMEL